LLVLWQHSGVNLLAKMEAHKKKQEQEKVK
jgi:hypothetical protein